MEVNAEINVLVVDDEPELRELYAANLFKRGFHVVVADSGHKALEIVQKGGVDLVLSDIRMAEGDGVELLSNIRKLDPEKPPVILFTAFSDRSVDELYAMGAAAVFFKPFNWEALAQLARKVLLPRQPGQPPRHERVDTDLPVSLRLPGVEGVLSARVRNLSSGGMFISIDGFTPNVGAQVDFTIEGRLEPRIHGTGHVKWMRAQKPGADMPGCGIEITSLDATGRRRLVELINAIKTGSLDSADIC